MERLIRFLSLILFFWNIACSSARKHAIESFRCTSYLPNGDYYNFTQAGTIDYFTISDPESIQMWNFIVEFCGIVDNIEGNITNVAAEYWEGWYMGELSQFDKMDSTVSYNFFQMYTNGDQGYPCTSGRQTQAFLYCDGCPEGSQCHNGTQDFCICSGMYTDFYPDGDPCTANLNISVACPPLTVASTVPIPTENPHLSGAQVFGIVLFVFVCLTFVGCFAGTIYNRKINGRTGIEAIPGYMFLSKERSGMNKFSGTSYQKTASEGHYGTL